MVLSRSSTNRIATALCLVGLLIMLPGCPLSPEKDNGGNQNPDTLIERNTVDGALGRLAQIWEQKLYNDYADLLHDGFRFYVRSDEADQFPWIPNQYWGKTEELDFAQHMFDPDFTGESPPVQSINWDFTILGERQTTDVDGEPVTEVTTDAVITVLTGPNDGFTSDTRFVFQVIADPQNPGLYQIKQQQEVLKL